MWLYNAHHSSLSSSFLFFLKASRHDKSRLLSVDQGMICSANSTISLVSLDVEWRRIILLFFFFPLKARHATSSVNLSVDQGNGCRVFQMRVIAWCTIDRPALLNSFLSKLAPLTIQFRIGIRYVICQGGKFWEKGIQRKFGGKCLLSPGLSLYWGNEYSLWWKFASREKPLRRKTHT